MTADAGTSCECIDAVATDDAQDPRLQWPSGPPNLTARQRLVVVGVAWKVCQFPFDVGRRMSARPHVSGVAREGVAIVIDLVPEDFTLAAEAIAVPKDSADKIVLRMHGSVIAPDEQAGRLQTCSVVPRQVAREGDDPGAGAP